MLHRLAAPAKPLLGPEHLQQHNTEHPGVKSQGFTQTTRLGMITLEGVRRHQPLPKTSQQPSIKAEYCQKQLSFGCPALVILKGIAFAQAIRQMPGIQGGLKQPKLGTWKQKHLQAPAAEGSSSIARPPKDAQGARSRTARQLQLPVAHFTAPATRPPSHPTKYCCLGHKTSCKQHSER